MHIKLDYGSTAIPIDVPDNWINGRCVRPTHMTPTGDARAELISALGGLPDDMRLETILGERSSCVIVVDPESEIVYGELLEALIELIEDASTLSPAEITILVANRVLNPFTAADLPKLIPESITKTHPVILHDAAKADALQSHGNTSRRVPVTLNKAYSAADFKIILGAVRPNSFAGYSGGRWTLVPGIAGEKTIKAVFDFNNIADPHARIGNFRDNPFHITGLEVLNMVGCDLAINAVITPENSLYRVTAGHFGQSHLAAMSMLREAMTVRLKEPMDIIVTSGGGNPHDRTLFGLMPTLLSTKPVLKPEGTIVVAAALEDGIGPPEFEEALLAFPSIREGLTACSTGQGLSPAFFYAQQLYSILQEHEIIIYTTGISEDMAWRIGLTPAKEMNDAVLGAMESHGQRCKIAALPEGPMGIAEIIS